MVRVRLTLGQPSAEWALAVGEVPVVVGRADAKTRTVPEVDLSAHDAHQNGVSRVHVHLFIQDGQLYAEDQNSVNGTFINEERLAPYVAHRLRDGDILRVGRLRLVVRLG